jgi:hypothetical protein
MIMIQLNQMEANSIREIVGCHQTSSAKLAAYAEACQDQQIKQMFQQASQEAKTGAQKLIQML